MFDSMSDSFNTEVEDGSVGEVIVFFSLCRIYPSYRP
jgi:hypothetical protein